MSKELAVQEAPNIPEMQGGVWCGYLGAYNIINKLSLPSYLANEVE